MCVEHILERTLKKFFHIEEPKNLNGLKSLKVMIVPPSLQQLMLDDPHEIFVLMQEWMKGMAILVVEFPRKGYRIELDRFLAKKLNRYYL